VGGNGGDTVMSMAPDEQMPLIKRKPSVAGQIRHLRG
jgi:hypothetical protein